MTLARIGRQRFGIDGIRFCQCAAGTDEGFDLSGIRAMAYDGVGQTQLQEQKSIAASCFAEEEGGVWQAL